MFAALPRAKRQRSSSPPLPQEYIDLTSPLDILIKRRRKEGGIYTSEAFNAYPFPDISPSNDPMEGSSSWFATRPSAAINGRRSRQWQHLNAPSSSSVSSTSTLPLPHSQPYPSINLGPGSGSSPFSIEHGRAHTQPDIILHGTGRSGHIMSSSPIRHESPGSSPFRSSGQSRLGMDMGMEEVLRAATPPMAQEDDWDEDELGKEWGEYARENSVLYSLHRQRHGTSPYSSTETPSRPTTYNHQTYNPQLHPTPYRDRPSSSASTQFPSSSPFHPMGTPSDMTRRNYHLNEQDEGGGMREDGDVEEREEVLSPGEREVRRRYEDANRLLKELAVDRRRRWGET